MMLLGTGIVEAAYIGSSLLQVQWRLCPSGHAVTRQTRGPYLGYTTQALWGLAAAWAVSRDRDQRP